MEIKDLENIASLVGEPARAKMLWSLLDGRAYTATELSHFSDTSPQGASLHLSKMVQAGLLKVSVQGRHRYYNFARDEVAYAMEALGCLAGALSKKTFKTSPPDKESPIKYCRTCYDHLAGKVGVAVHDGLVERNYMTLTEGHYQVTAEGQKWFTAQAIDPEILSGERRAFAIPCLDWSERRHHLAGALGAALLKSFLHHDYVRRTRDSRIIVITSKGRGQLYGSLGVEV